MKKKKHKGNTSLFYKILQVLMKLPVLQNIRILFYFYDKTVLAFLRKPKRIQGEKKKVLVVFPFALGDCVLFLGAIENMRRIYPKEQYYLELTCQAGYEALFEKYFDSVIPLQYQKASVNPFYRASMWKRLRECHYDLVIDPIGCEECSPNVYVANAVCADKKTGVLTKSDKKIQCPQWMRNRIYDEVIVIEQKHLHKIKYYACVWEKIGGITATAHPAELPRMALDIKLPEHYFIVFPSASLPAKQWTTEGFAEIAGRLHKLTGYPLVVCGTEHDAGTIEEMLAQIPEIPVINLVGKTNVSEFIEIIGRTDLLVTNDTSAYHIGVAQRRKVCIVTGGYVYDAFIHYDYAAEGYENPSIVCKWRKCYNCNNMCSYKVKHAYPCVEENTVEDVWEAVKNLWEQKRDEK